jgi:tetratricopeptide (TPR) repeat protein
MKWLMLGLTIVLVPMLVEGQERPAAKRDAKAPEAASKQDGSKGPDRRIQAEAHYELGVIHHERVFESLDQAIAEYEQAVKLRPDYADAYYNLGLSYHTKAKLGTDDVKLYKKALAAYKTYLKYSPKGELASKAKQNIRVVEARIKR